MVHSLTLVSGALIVTLLGPLEALAQAERPRAAGELLLQHRGPSAAQQRARGGTVMSQLRLTLVDSLLDGAVERYRTDLDAAVGAEEALAATLMATGAFAFAEPNYLVEPAVIPDDPAFASEWHHATIRSSDAWDLVVSTRSILIVVCDGGFDPTHRDLIDNLVLPGYNVVDGTVNIASTMDHGTLVTGVIGAVGNNGQDAAGVSWDSRILPVRISNRPDGWALMSDTVRCIEYAADAGARVVNVSYGGLFTSAAVDSAAAHLRSRGGVFIGAAANDGRDLSTYPNSPNMLLVGGTDADDTLASFSNHGGPVDLVAPGRGIVTTGNPAITGRTVVSASGTSFSSPMVAGVAALIFALSPDFTPEEVEEILLSTAVDLGVPGPDLFFARGRIDAGAAVAEAAERLARRDREPPPVVDHLVTMDGFEVESSDQPFVIRATFTNISLTPVYRPIFEVIDLGGGNTLANADDGPAGVGATLSPDVDDGILEPGEVMEVQFVIELASRAPFTFRVTLRGDLAGG